MDISFLLSKEVQDFVLENYQNDIGLLSLKYKSKFQNWDLIVDQLKGKQKSNKKLPTWFNTENIVFPKSISIEQSSSEVTAKYKSQIVSGKTLIDLTGGLGVDDYYFSKTTQSVFHCEMNPELSDIVAHNCRVLNIDNITCHKGDSLDLLKSSITFWDWIYIDPARRDESQNKVFLFQDCTPNIIEHQELMFSKASNILIKTSPLFDLSAGIKILKHIKTIHIVSVNNEVKELLWELNASHEGDTKISTVNISQNETVRFDFNWHTKDYVTVPFANPQKFLYVPNASIMKSGGYDVLCEKLELHKLHQHSHLFTSEKLIEFPGRAFEITTVIPYNKKEVKPFIQGKQLNISVRNFPENVNQLKKKWKINDGGNTYCFFTTNCYNEKIVIFGTKVTHQ